jgi:hypothetical protein
MIAATPTSGSCCGPDRRQITALVWLTVAFVSIKALLMQS